MKVKKYTASTMREALEKMKSDLGTGAVILGSRKISRGGLLDFLGREMFEVTATNEENILPQKSKPSAPMIRPSGSRLSVTVGDNGPVADPRPEEFSRVVRGTLEGIEPPLAEPVERNAATSTTVIRQLKQELRELKGGMTEMAEQMRYQRMPALPPILKEIYKKLVDNELEEKLALELIQKLYGRFSENQYSNRDIVEDYLIGEISSMIKAVGPTPIREKEPLVIAFIGPSGVGKTTCLAKLATNKKFYGNNRLAMITADNYRVAATQQLGTFSEIADIPLEIVHSPRDLTKALARHKDKEAIMLDTAGGSQFNERLRGELASVLEAAAPDEIHLVLSVTTKAKDLLQAIKGFRMGPNVRLLLTKFDESLTFGSIVSVAREAGLPLSYLTFGQEVPEDLEAADAEKIARLVVKNVF
jgi:flagellar biosynthesis protein FlhF